MLDYKAIGRRIAYYRRIANLTQSALAEQLNISDGYISQIETGATKPSLSRLDKIADLLKVDIACLVSDKTVATNVPFNSELFELTKGWSREQTSLLIGLVSRANELMNNE